MKATLLPSFLVASASAHTIWTQLHVNGVAQGHTKGIRVPVRHTVGTLSAPQSQLLLMLSLEIRRVELDRACI